MRRSSTAENRRVDLGGDKPSGADSGSVEGAPAEPTSSLFVAKQIAAAGQTPAAENDRIYAMEDLYLMGFGPRTGQAIADLARLLQRDGDHQHQAGGHDVVAGLEVVGGAFSGAVAGFRVWDTVIAQATLVEFAFKDAVYGGHPDYAALSAVSDFEVGEVMLVDIPPINAEQGATE